MKTTTFLKGATNYLLATAMACLVLTACKKSDSGPVVNNDLFSKVTLASTGGSFIYPSSAIPDANSQFVYFLASDSNGAGVFKVPAAGGTAVEVFVGAPFSKPTDLALSTDNQTLFVADPNAPGSGGIYSLTINGSMPVLVPGTGGTSPMALDVIQRSGQDEIYFCGTNASDALKAVFEIASDGAGAPTIRYKGMPLVSPAGIVSAKDGSLFIADGAGIVRKLPASGMISQIAGGIIMGSPAGVALTPDENSVMISSKNPGDGTAQVEVISLQTGSISIFNKGIGVNSNPGGLHVGRNSTGSTGKYGWADVSRNGRVYHIEP